MKSLFLTAALAGLSMMISSSVASASFETWAKISQPLEGPADAIGSYSAGCLAGAVAMPESGPGFAVMKPQRKRYYGHPFLIDYITDLGLRLKNQNLPVMLVGNLSAPGGGPMRTGHASHQSGLDVDIWYTMGKTMPSKSQRNTWGATEYVVGRKKLKKAWGPEQTKLVVTAADSDKVNRIFVSPAIKKHLCEKFPEAPWQYKLRSWWAHGDHLHVRLNCPPGSANCTPQDALDPKENGCGTELAWWFSKEADDDWLKISKDRTPREFPKLPEACEKLTGGSLAQSTDSVAH